MQIIYYDRQIAVCLKPVGLESQTQLPQAVCDELGGECYPVHRLDRNVGGLLLCARTRKAAVELSAAVQAGTVVKEYIAVVHGLPPERGDWEDLLFKDSGKNKVFVVKSERKGVKRARLEFTRLSAGETSRVRVRLHTGRTHQIRVQFASRGFPLVGDHKYGARDDVAAPMLFCCALRFPFGGKTFDFEQLPPW